MTWDPRHFPTPQNMQENLGIVNCKLVTTIDPHVKNSHINYTHTYSHNKLHSWKEYAFVFFLHRYMTWDPRHFPTPQNMQNLGIVNHKLVTIIDPHVKRERTHPKKMRVKK